jgi:hypothetical protein
VSPHFETVVSLLTPTSPLLCSSSLRSNTPVQWDSPAVSSDLDGLSRYYNSAGADLKKIPDARTVELAERAFAPFLYLS